MAETLPTPSRWRRFRHRQAWFAVPFLLLAMTGLLATVAGVLPGLAIVLLFGPLGLLCALNARSGRRGGRSARPVDRDGATYLEFPAHRLGSLLILLLVALSLAFLVFLTLLYTWEGLHGSTAAGAAAALLAAMTGYGTYGLWAARSPTAHRGWPAVRLGADGVELAGSIPPAVIDADLAVVAATVFFYGREPERRAELTTRSGVERVRGGELPQPWPGDL